MFPPYYLVISFQYVTSLESKLKEAALKNLALLKENQDLKTKVSRLQEEVSVSPSFPSPPSFTLFPLELIVLS